MSFASNTLDLVIIGRSILSSYANPTAELYRGLINELAHHGHRTTFLEPVDPNSVARRDLLRSPYCEVWTYSDVEILLEEYLPAIQSADLVMLGSGIPQSDRIANWIIEEARGITIYYDADLARTTSSLAAGIPCDTCLSRDVIRSFNLYLSTTGGPALESLAHTYGIRCARPLYESIDPFSYYRMDIDKSYDLGFIGNFKSERTALIDALLLSPARTTPNRQFILAGDGYPAGHAWPQNLTYLEHLPDTNHVDFYNRQSCTLILGHDDRRRLGYTPSRQLLAAAACGVPVLTREWSGLSDFFESTRELFCVETEQDVLDVLYGTEESVRRKVGNCARQRVLEAHTTAHRAQQLLAYWEEVAD
ncbi:spore maturation protein CgeB [Lewinella aquimaris]|uniref:Spore maturation protein CgeB n=1 Tax=Neolewinella aquimaris TaxID=1835722 RepID=A0A840E1B8_9BACT|nr:glycosyltransferase [Neolewinella aquimaris]MBB4077562.1 spore maturation protein CgeB [Neolewinella aquimaris]